MFLEFLLFINWLCALLFSIYYNYKKPVINNLLFAQFGLLSIIGIIKLAVLIPIFEEIIFRHYLVQYTNHLEYSNLINAGLFGLAHYSNYIGVKDWFFLNMQVLFAFYMGYYFLSLNSVYLSSIAHIVYNLSLIIVCYFILHLRRTEYFRNFGALNNFQKKYYYVTYNKLRRSKSCSNIREDKLSNTSFIDFEINKLDKDLQKSFEEYEKLDKIKNKTKIFIN